MPSITVVDGKILNSSSLAKRMCMVGEPTSSSMLRYVFLGKRDLSLRKFKALARVMGLTLDQLDDLIERVRAGKFYRVGI